MSDMFWIQISTLAAVIAGFIYNYLREKRKERAEVDREQRKRVWEIEDREQRRKDAVALAQFTAKEAGKLTAKVEEQHREVIEINRQAIEKGEAAYNEANGLTRKIAEGQRNIADMQAQLLVLRNRPPRASDARIDQIVEATEQIRAVVVRE